MALIGIACGEMVCTLDTARAWICALASRGADGSYEHIVRSDPRVAPSGDWVGGVRAVLDGGLADDAWRIMDRSPGTARLALCDENDRVVSVFRAEVDPSGLVIDVSGDARAIEFALSRGVAWALESDRLEGRLGSGGVCVHIERAGDLGAIEVSDESENWAICRCAMRGGADASGRLRFSVSGIRR